MTETPSITFFNSTGDVTITWDKTNEAAMLLLIEQKMKQNYSFFILKRPFLGIGRTKEVEARSIQEVRKAGSVVVKDDAVASMVSNLNLGDADVESVVAAGHANVAPPPVSRNCDTVGRAKTAQEVLQHNTVAYRPVVGG